MTALFNERRLVERPKVAHHYYRFPSEASGAGFEQDGGRPPRSIDVSRQSCGNHGSEIRSVEAIRGDHEYWSPPSWSRSQHRAEIAPPDVTPADLYSFHSTESQVRRPASLSHASKASSSAACSAVRAASFTRTALICAVSSSALSCSSTRKASRARA